MLFKSNILFNRNLMYTLRMVVLFVLLFNSI